MRLLVTGGSGTVGRRLVKELTNEGNQVIALGREGNYSTGIVPSSYEVDDLIEKLAGVEAVIHLAWRREPSERLESFFPNLRETENLLAAAAAAGVRRVIGASSISVYSGHDLPWIEGGRPLPSTAYGLSKLVGEDLLTRAAHFGLSTASLRIGHVYSDDEDNDYAVNVFIRKAEAGEPITVTGDRHRTRDMVYVADVCDAFKLALDSDYVGPVNVGSGSPVSMGQIARAAVDSFHSPSCITVDEVDGTGTGSTLMDLDRAAAELRYAPKYDIHQGMADIAARRGSRR